MHTFLHAQKQSPAEIHQQLCHAHISACSKATSSRNPPTSVPCTHFCMLKSNLQQKSTNKCAMHTFLHAQKQSPAEIHHQVCHAHISACSEAISRKDPPPIVPCTHIYMPRSNLQQRSTINCAMHTSACSEAISSRNPLPIVPCTHFCMLRSNLQQKSTTNCTTYTFLHAQKQSSGEIHHQLCHACISACSEAIPSRNSPPIVPHTLLHAQKQSPAEIHHQLYHTHFCMLRSNLQLKSTINCATHTFLHAQKQSLGEIHHQWCHAHISAYSETISSREPPSIVPYTLSISSGITRDGWPLRSSSCTLVWPSVD